MPDTMPQEAIADRPEHGRSAWVKGSWDAIVTWVRREPVAAQSIILVFIALGIAFQWWHWSDGQTGAVVGIAVALLGMFVRSQVAPLLRQTTSENRSTLLSDRVAPGKTGRPRAE
jgi:hypothetical protein